MPYYVYVSLQDDDKILVFAMNSETGKLTLKATVPVSGGPVGLAVNPNRKFLYVGRRWEYDIASFRIDQTNGDITQIGSAPVQGEPLDVATDQKGNYVLSYYYAQRTVAVHRIEKGAAVIPAVEWVMTAFGAHDFQTDPSNRFAFVPHIGGWGGRGANRIYQFKFDETTGHLTPNSPSVIEPTEDLGPRQVCFHPFLDTVYSSNEQGSSVTAYRLDTQRGTLSAIQTISSLPQGYIEPNACSQIKIAYDGRCLYVANRGHNSIARFTVDPSNGTLSTASHVATQAVPRSFGLDPQGKFVYAVGQDTGHLTSYVINQANGELTPAEIYPVGNQPMWVLPVKLSG